MNELVQYAQSIIDYLTQNGPNLNVESQQALAQFLQQILQVIEQQQNPVEGLQPNAGQVPEVPTGQFPSSNVNGFKYDPDSQEMMVQFHGPYPQAAGPIYKYDKVPPYIYDIISRGAIGPKTSGKNQYHEWIKGITPSLGASVNALLKAGNFQYQKVS